MFFFFFFGMDLEIERNGRKSSGLEKGGFCEIQVIFGCGKRIGCGYKLEDSRDFGGGGYLV